MDIPFYQTVTVTVPNVLPEVTTERLILRPVEHQDAFHLSVIRQHAELFKYWQVTYFIPDMLIENRLIDVYSYPWFPDKRIEDTIVFLEGRFFTDGPQRIRGRSFFYVLRIKPTGSTPDPSPVIGWVSLLAIAPVPEIFCAIHPRCSRRGFMTEAVKTVLDVWWGLPRMENEWRLYADEPEYVYAACATQNIAGKKLLEKCGFEKYSSEERERRGAMLFRIGKVFPVTPTRPTGETNEKPVSLEGII